MIYSMSRDIYDMPRSAVICVFFYSKKKKNRRLKALSTVLLFVIFVLDLCFSTGMVGAVGISNLQFVDMNSPRNLFVFGVPLFCGLSASGWINKNPEAIDTGTGVDIYGF